MVYACPHCHSYFDGSLQPLPNDEAALAREATKGAIRKVRSGIKEKKAK